LACGPLGVKGRPSDATLSLRGEQRARLVCSARPQSENRSMADAELLGNQKSILANQAEIKSNQAQIKANQADIKSNQDKLDLLLANQVEIKKNQEEILANQKEILSTVRRE
jgi:hypothetical protein